MLPWSVPIHISLLKRDMEVIEPMEFTYDIPQSDNMKKVQELMVTGFSGNLNFERDFVAEGIEMLNRFELQ